MSRPAPFRVRVVCACTVLIAAASAVAVAGTPPVYHPLEIGWLWSYTNDKVTATVTIERSTTVLGAPVFTRRTETPVQIFQSFWSMDDDGNLYLHGAENLTFPYYAAYDPPILWLDLPLLVGKTWTQTFTVCDEGENPPCASSVSYTHTIVSESALTVPYGTLDAFQLQVQAEVRPFPPAFDLLGRRVPTGRGDVLDAEEWFTAETGRAQYRDTTTGTIFQLVSVTTPTPVDETTWSRVKDAFRWSARR